MSEEAIRLMTKAHVDALSYKSFLDQERHKTVRDAVSQMHEMLRDCAPEAAIARLIETANTLRTLQRAQAKAAEKERELRDLSTKVIDEIERAKADPWPS